MHIAYVTCRGSESSLAECSYTTHFSSTCVRSSGVVGVQCRSGRQTLILKTMHKNLFYTLENIQHGELRITNGVTKYEGRVEVYRNSEWTLVCNDGWDELDARVVCRQLNYKSTSVQVKSTHFS